MTVHAFDQRSRSQGTRGTGGFWSPERLEAPMSLELLSHEWHLSSAGATRRQVGECELIALDCPAGTVRCEGESKISGRLCVLLLLHGSADAVTPLGKMALKQGDFLLHEDGKTLELKFTSPARLLMLLVPQGIVRQRLHWLHRLAGLQVSGTQGPGALFSAFLRDAWKGLQRYDGAWSASLGEVLWPMIEMVYTAKRAGVVQASRSEERRQSLFAFIDKNLCEPDLDTCTLADAMGTSTRYVQMLFSEIGTTPSAYVRNRRLDLAAAQLARGGPSTSITQTAFEVGFNDLSSFCRAFRNRFHVAPRDYRAGYRSEAIAA